MKWSKIKKWNYVIEDDGTIEIESGNGKFFMLKVTDVDRSSATVVFSKKDVENLIEMFSDMLKSD